MEIVILRHGKPKIAIEKRVTASDFGTWINAYNEAGIDDADPPPPSAVARSKRCAATVCSDLPRSLESAKALDAKDVIAQDSLFRECEMPYANWRYPRLPILVWATLFRALQVFGYNSNAESYRAARERAHICAIRLSELAKSHNSVLFVGHGLLNRLIAKKLLRMGWEGPRRVGYRHWDYGAYRYNVS